ncbi:hypothetical protein QAD02_017632 [Eretmocerus hayati]|uniref:Uncharacterized protein n=1 Tax=Eretmocerus hayati TaxID=131215 RepID=A0ACC2PJ78_9HYME|nr:hypothetical protein QAD02_017632 [Eretmocerus hayati]
MDSELFQTSEITIDAVKKSSGKLGPVLAAITGGVGVAITLVCIPFVAPGFRRICLPYVPATPEQVKNVLRALKGCSGSLIDIGSGDGRIVIAAAKAGFQADGVELNPWLIRYSKISAMANGVSSKTSFFKKDLWTYNLKKYDNIVVFGVEEMMPELEDKFRSELRPKSSIVACRFPLPNCQAVTTIGEGLDTVWFYQTPLTHGNSR